MTYERGIIAGSFDILHPGYIRMFEESKRVVNYLIVALQDDPTIDRPEKCKPVQSWEERAEILRSLRYVDDVVYYNTEYDLRKLLGSVKYDVRILGSDYLGRRFTGDDLEKPVFYCNRNHQYSLTDLKERIAESMLNR
jgi:glycerol-3-phosphate cytidylyltransferase